MCSSDLAARRPHGVARYSCELDYAPNGATRETALTAVSTEILVSTTSFEPSTLGSYQTSERLPGPGGREIWGFPEKLANLKIGHENETMFATLVSTWKLHVVVRYYCEEAERRVVSAGSHRALRACAGRRCTPTRALLGILVGARRDRDRFPFAMTVLFFLAAFLSLVVMFWPYMIPYSVSVASAAAPEATLRFFFYGGIVVLSVIVIYTIAVYWVFRGKIRRA